MTESHRLTASVPFCAVLRKSGHWRGLVIGTPALWATIEMDFGYANISTAANKRIVQFVKSALERSGNMPLQIYIRSPDFGPTTGGSVLELLAQHSHRWKDASIWTERHSYQQVIKCLTSANDHFPLLERLLIDGVPVDHDLFQFSPRLTLEGSIPENLKPNLPWNQLRSTTSPGQYYNCVVAHKLRGFHSIAHGSPKNLFSDSQLPQLAIFQQSSLTFILSPSISVMGPGSAFEDGAHVSSRLLVTNCFSGILYPLISPRYPPRARDIQSGDLRRPTSGVPGLPRVEILSVSDPNHWDAVPDNWQLLINDDLLRGLTWTSDTGLALVPQLHSFACDTFMQFEESSYVVFISSCVGPGRNADGPFESSILYSRGKGATVEAPLAKRLSVRLSQFVLRKELRSRIERDDLRSFSCVEESE
ncbi:hypothetical protein B0H14DRAFT_3728369 [Mycena olivaceomarginata]|nr:hypothetical protein B0H14DRAFT_3728369 [Mycena olivaceomarginata]